MGAARGWRLRCCVRSRRVLRFYRKNGRGGGCSVDSGQMAGSGPLENPVRGGAAQCRRCRPHRRPPEARYPQAPARRGRQAVVSIRSHSYGLCPFVGARPSPWASVSDCRRTGWRCWCPWSASVKKTPLFRRGGRGLHRRGGRVGGRNRPRQSGSAGSIRSGGIAGLLDILNIGPGIPQSTIAGPDLSNSAAPKGLQASGGAGALRPPVLPRSSPGRSPGTLKVTFPRSANRRQISGDFTANHSGRESRLSV